MHIADYIVLGALDRMYALGRGYGFVQSPVALLCPRPNQRGGKRRAGNTVRLY